MKRLLLAIPLCLIALGLSPAPVSADPVTLTTGNIFYHVGDPLFVTLPSIEGFIVGGDAGHLPSWTCACTPGETVNTSVSEDFAVIGAGGSFVFQGTTYNVTDTGSFTINSGQVTVPSIPTGPGSTGFATVFTPFTFSGTLTGVSAMGMMTSLELSGSGTAAIMFNQGTSGNPQFFSASYGFESAAPVPEPGTLLLVGAAAAGLVARRRLRTRRE